LYTGVYTVQTGDTSADLSVTSIANGADASRYPTDEAGNALVLMLPTGRNLSDNKNFVIDTTPPEAVDLSTDSDKQSTGTTVTNTAAINIGVAFDASIQAPDATDIKTIKVVLAGADLSITHDKLVLDSALALDVDIATVTGKTIGGVSGLKYSYIASSKTWIISSTSDNLGTAEVKTIVESLKLKNTDTNSQKGVRTATISYIDAAGNEGNAATALLKVEVNRGFIVNGEVANDKSGYSVSSAGDINGDGLDDLIIGAYGANGGKGKSYVVFGKTNSTAVNLSVIASGTGGFVINGETVNDKSGYSVSSAGDVNGDGLDDLIIGAYGANESKGRSYVVFGKTNGTVTNLSDITGSTGGFIINGETTGDFSGYSVSSAGDINGDGLDDLIIGTWGADTTTRINAGKSYVIFGKTNSAAINLSDIASASDTGGFVINGEMENDSSGRSVSSAGDVNGDGLDDLIVGAYGADPSNKSNAGKSYVVFGKISSTAISLDAIANGTGGFVINGENAQDLSGKSVSSAGDVNGDGLDDLIVGAGNANTIGGDDAGKSYVVFGKTDTTAINLSAIASGTGGFVINGEKVWDLSGDPVSSAGDVNGDGLDDLIIGARRAGTTSDDNTGKSYVVFGKTDTTAINLNAIVNGVGGFVINGGAKSGYSSYSVSSAGDVNGDGLDDLIVGTAYADPNGGNSGKSYIIFGKTNTNAINLSQFGGDSKYTIDFQGTTGDDTLTSTHTNKDEIFVSGAGNDTLTGNGGMDVFSAGAGNDTVIISANNITALEKIGAGNRANINGGSGIDTLKLDGSGLILDLTKISNNRIKDIEKIDLTGSGDNLFKLSLNDVLDASTSTNTLKVLGNSGDKVHLDNNNWTTSNTQTEDSITYNVYTSSDTNPNANVALWISMHMRVDIIPDAVDLSTNSGVQSISTTIANIAAINAGTAFDTDIQTPTATNIKTIKVVLAGADLSATHDKLVLDSDLALDVDIATETDKTIAGVSGLEYSYIANSKTWTISKTSGSLTVANVESIVEALKLKNTDIELQEGVRTATISYVDTFGNEGISAMASLKVEVNRGFTINGEAASDHSGHSVSSAGDVNGDGLDDLIIGAYHADSGDKSGAGNSYVVFGKTNGIAVNLSAIADGVGGFIINGETASDYSGYSVSSAGDVNGDGLDDLIIGAYRADPSDRSSAGKSYVIFGKTNGTAINLGDIESGTSGFVINGEATNDRSGYSVSSAGDVNGDGLDDLIVGAWGANLSKGKSYVVFGKINSTDINLSDIASGIGGFVINGEKDYDYSGYSVSSAGDVNGDGLDDLIVAVYYLNNAGG
ncbi:MAG: hypothetical protein FE834_08505, partial [Gammaproteobacteria bacterium]|nr:hypothetical protein [Gammaproteobacteria bacterium]